MPKTEPAKVSCPICERYFRPQNLAKHIEKCERDHADKEAGQ